MLPCLAQRDGLKASLETSSRLEIAAKQKFYKMEHKIKTNWPGPFLCACFFLRFEVQKKVLLCHIVLLQISIALRPSRPALKPALMCFVLISMVSRHWSSRLALRPPPTLFHLTIFWVCCNFHNLEASRLALRPSLCASCGLKF